MPSCKAICCINKIGKAPGKTCFQFLTRSFFLRNPISGVTPEVFKEFLNFRPRVPYIFS